LGEGFTLIKTLRGWGAYSGSKKERKMLGRDRDALLVKMKKQRASGGKKGGIGGHIQGGGKASCIGLGIKERKRKKRGGGERKKRERGEGKGGSQWSKRESNQGKKGSRNPVFSRNGGRLL